MPSLKISQNLGLAFYLGCVGAGGGRRLNSYGELGIVHGLSLLKMVPVCLSIWGWGWVGVSLVTGNCSWNFSLLKVVLVQKSQ